MRNGKVLTTSLVTGVGVPDVVGATGVRFVLSDGRDVIDATNSPAALGHRHPRIVEAIRSSVLESPVIDEGWAWPEREKTAEDLLKIAFAGEEHWLGAVRFLLSGSEANDAALSLAQALTGRTALVTRERAYHGMVGLARDVTLQPQWHGGLSSAESGIRPVPTSTEVRELPFPAGEMGNGVDLSDDEAEEILRPALHLFDDAAAVIIDYSQGGRYPAPAYQDAVARHARDRGVLWIADEVVTGFGKQGRWFNFQRGRERPDMVTMGKAFGGGLVAAGGLILSNDVLRRIGDASWKNYSALRAQPITVAAIREFIHVVHDEGLVERVDALHPSMVAGMNKLRARHPSLGRIDGRGLHWTLELQGYDWRDWHGDSGAVPLADEVAAAALEAGVLIATSGEGGSLLLSLPQIIEMEDIESVFAALDRALEVSDAAI